MVLTITILFFFLFGYFFYLINKQKKIINLNYTQYKKDIEELKNYRTFKLEKSIEFNCSSNLDDYEEKLKKAEEELKTEIIIQNELKGNGNQDLETVKKRLLDDSFFNDSHWNYNIIRT